MWSGAALITAAAIPHLTETRGVAAYLSSISASFTPPWPGLGAYATSKAALDTMVEAWRNEHPAVGFTRVIVGDCAGGEGASATEFANGWDWDLAAEFHPIWQARNYLTGSSWRSTSWCGWWTPCCAAAPAPIFRRWPSPPDPRSEPAGRARLRLPVGVRYRKSSMLAMAVAPGKEPVMPELM